MKKERGRRCETKQLEVERLKPLHGRTDRFTGRFAGEQDEERRGDGDQ